MAKKHFGRLMAFAAIAGTAAAGISYFLRYKSFHKELDEDFHDFEDDFDEDLKEFGETGGEGKPLTRNYVSLTPDRQTSRDPEDNGERESESAQGPEETPAEISETEVHGALVPDTVSPETKVSEAKAGTGAEPSEASEADSDSPADSHAEPSSPAAVKPQETAPEVSGEAADESAESCPKQSQSATTIIEEAAE